MFTLLLALSACISTPATPQPAAALVTVAAQHSAEAQQAQAKVDDLAQQLDAAQKDADQKFADAQKAANEASTALAVQQVGAAGEAIGRANAAIQAGQDSIAKMNGAVTQLTNIISAQWITITAQATELQTLRASLKTTNDAFATVYQQNEDNKSKGDIGYYAQLLSFGLFAILLGWMLISAIQRRRNTIDIVDVHSEVVDDATEDETSSGGRDAEQRDRRAAGSDEVKG